MSDTLSRTPLFAQHMERGARMVEFGGWEMPLHYSGGIFQEHLATRRGAGIFDISHMGRFILTGRNALPFIQYVCTNNAAALETGQSQYTILADEQGGAVDDAYLYRFFDDAYLLVVNAANREKDRRHLEAAVLGYNEVFIDDRSDELSMLSLQGPLSKEILISLVGEGRLPQARRNALRATGDGDGALWLARTGYSGEPIGFELFIPRAKMVETWRNLLALGATPAGLGARDTLRLEAGLPLYGHELGLTPEGRIIPVFALDIARIAVSFSAHKGDFLGCEALRRQFESVKAQMAGQPNPSPHLPERIRTVQVMDKGIARRGARVFQGEATGDKAIGYVTSGTMVPYWEFQGEGVLARLSTRSRRRAIALVLIDADVKENDIIQVEVQGKRLNAMVMPYLLRREAPPYARPITPELLKPAAHTQQTAIDTGRLLNSAKSWIRRGLENTRWRQARCINLIPSEQTPSELVRLMSVMDPMGRYAEHKPVKAFADGQVFYYQGTDFIAAVEAETEAQLRRYLGCRQIETRPVSGQMANMVMFSALVDFINRLDRKSEPRRINGVMNHHLSNGGHLSAQPLGALRDFIRHDPVTDRAAVVNFPVLPHDPFQVDLAACRRLLERFQPELVILGKSMTLYREPVQELRHMIDEVSPASLLMYDTAHVLGLLGPDYQDPFGEGADVITGSTHKTFFGTQRGIVAADFRPDDPQKAELWNAVNRRAFPGSVSNHHLGTLLGLLVAALEMNAFKGEYQPKVIANAKAFARALHDCGLDLAGDPAVDFTETHQVIIRVGPNQGPRLARRLEDNNIICNFQATPEDEGFTASGALRLGVAEMTRFAMESADFQSLAQLIADVILRDKPVKAPIDALRRHHEKMMYCFEDAEIEQLLSQLHHLI